MNIFLPAEDGGEVELSPFAITASLYRGSAPASTASSSSSRRSSTSSVASSASYRTAEDHPGDPPDYSVLEPLLTPKRPHPMRPSLLRFQFCLSDPPKTYYTPTPGGPIHKRTSEHLDVAKRGKQMLEQIIKARKGVVCEDPIQGEPSDPSFSYMIIPHDRPALVDEYWMALIRNGRQRKWRPIALGRFARLVDRLDGWLNDSPEHWNLACQHLYLFSVDEHGHPSEWYDGETRPRRMLKAIKDAENTPRPGDELSRSSESSHLVTPEDTHAVLPETPAVEIPTEMPVEPKKEEPAAPTARGHRGRRHRRKEEDLAPPPIRPPKAGDWDDWTGTRGSRGQNSSPFSTKSPASGSTRAPAALPTDSSRGPSSGRGKRAAPGPSPRRSAPSGSSQLREEDFIDRSFSGSSSSGGSSMRRSTSAESDLNANAPVFIPRRASSSSLDLVSATVPAEAVDDDITPRPGATVGNEGRVPNSVFPLEPLMAGGREKGSSTASATQPTRR